MIRYTFPHFFSYFGDSTQIKKIIILLINRIKFNSERESLDNLYATYRTELKMFKQFVRIDSNHYVYKIYIYIYVHKFNGRK